MTLPRAARPISSALVPLLVLVAALTVWLTAVRPASGASTGTGQLVVGAAAFTPLVESCEFAHGNIHGGDDPGVLEDRNRCSYVAPVTLPGGAVVKSLKLFYDSSAPGSRGVLELTRESASEIEGFMAAVTSQSGCSAPCSRADLSIAGATIDNSRFHYSLRMFNGGGSASGFRTLRAVILYKRP